MRSLYRENIRDIHTNNAIMASGGGSVKLKDYRLISLMQKKEEELKEVVDISEEGEDSTRKRVKLD